MSRIPAQALERASAYFEGGYWLLLINLVMSFIVAWSILSKGRSAQLRTLLENRFCSSTLQIFIFSFIYLLISFILNLPLSIYQGFFRERQYGLLNQQFMQWFGEQVIGAALGLIIGGILLTVIITVIRKYPSSWPTYGTIVCIGIMSLFMMLGPVYIDPLFNDYKAVEAGPLKTSILSMATANGIPATDIYQFNASKQSDRISANVSGIFNTTSIRLNDNLLGRTTPTEIRAVMAHEMGHYVLNHVYKMLLAMMIIVFFAQWKISSIEDLAGIPLLVALLTIYMFFMIPFINTLIRTQENEADIFGPNTAREPDQAAEIYLKLTEYRKPDPSPIEEFIFYDHSGTRNRILMAMDFI